MDLSPLKSAVARLAEALEDYWADTSKSVVRDGLIQRFEFTYDLAPKTLRRILQSRTDQPEEIDRMTFSTMMRTAFEQGLIDENWPRWRNYRDMRNITSHTYDEGKALEVVVEIPRFLEDVRALVGRLTAAAG